ncbi:MAG TPA: hypothetical protein VIX17_07450 [Pyrinomonadaceae bacterium]|jgi:hypothetical protein
MSQTIKRSISALLIAGLLILSGCDEGAVRKLGAKIGSRGQDVGTAAAKVIAELDEFEQVDYEQRLRVGILVRPPAMGTEDLPIVDHNKLEQDQITQREKLYKQLAKAYAALQTLSETAFADQSAAAVTELNNSINNIKAVPNIPVGVSSALSGLTGLIVDRKQAKDIRKYSLTLANLIKAHRALWESDRQIWDNYLARIRSAYIDQLNKTEADRFDLQQLRKIVTYPYADSYLINTYKAQEAARLDSRITEIKEHLDAVDEAFSQLEKAHKELTEEKPSYDDIVSSLDRIVTILGELKTNS